MGAQDHPFSVTSKFPSPDGAELLVTVRGPTVEQFAERLRQAHSVFPQAGFIGPDRAQAVADRNQAEANAERPPTSISQARRQGEAQAAQAAHANVRKQHTAAAVQPPVESVPVEGQGQEAPPADDGQGRCPTHHRAIPSNYGGVYCPVRNGDGEYCQWRRGPAPQAAQVN